MWMLRYKRFATAMAACSAALVLGVACSDNDGPSPTGDSGAGGGGGSSSGGKAGNAAGGKSGAPSGGAPSAGAPSAGAPNGGTSAGGSSGAGAGGGHAGAAGSGTAGAGGHGGTAGGSTAGAAGNGGAAGSTAGTGGHGGTAGGSTAGNGGTAGTAGGTAGTGGHGGTAGGSTAGAGGNGGTAGSTAGTGGNGGSAGAPPFIPVPITVLNSTFETGNDNQPAQNWQSTGDTAASYVHYNGGSAHAGFGYLAFYSATAFTVDTFQTINGLASGTYEFSAWIEGGTPLSIYAKNYSSNASDEKKTDVTPTASYVKYSVTGIPVTNGSITIGVRSTSAANGWANIDDVTLTRVQ